MKKIFVTILVLIFSMNQMSTANASTSIRHNKIFEKLVFTQVQAQFNSLSDYEQNKLFEDSQEELSKVSDMVSNMSNNEFEKAMENAKEQMGNSTFDSNRIVKNLSGEEKSYLTSQIEEETLLVTASDEDAIKIKLDSEFEKQKNSSLNKMSAMTKTGFVNKIKELKATIKEGIHEDKPLPSFGSGTIGGNSSNSVNIVKLKFIMYFVILGILAIAAAFLVPGIVFATTWAWATGAGIIGVSIIAMLMTKYML